MSVSAFAASPEEAVFQSLWSATGHVPVATPSLEGTGHTADVIVVGAGLTGLSTALHLAELGAKVYVLEANDPGWGASGRNGGQVIPGLKYDPDALLKKYGADLGEPLVRMVGESADTVFDLIDKYAIACDAVRAGWLQPAHSAKALEGLVERARQWGARGAPVQVLDRAQVRDRLGTDAYDGGWIDRRAGSIHPLNYLRGMLKAAVGLGVSVHGRSPVVTLERQGAVWEAVTQSGASVRAAQVVLGTNAYTDDLWPRLKQTVLPAYSFIVATAPLPASVGESILRDGVFASDSRRLLLYFRRDAAGRLLLGGRGPVNGPQSASDWEHLVRSMALLYPSLRGVPIVYRWAGRVAVTRDAMPHVHELAPGVMAALGYNGRGVAMSTQLGKHIALQLARGQALPFPLTGLKPIPLHGARRLYIGLGVACYALLDKLG